jgi:hypothetical protein
MATSTWYVNDDGIKLELDRITGNTMASGLGNGQLRLFKSNTTVSKSTVLGDLTECDFPGYSAASLNQSNWAAATVSAHVASSEYSSNVEFTRSSTGSAQSVYGAYITNAGNTELWGCSTFSDGPYVLDTAGQKVLVKPKWQVESKN